MSEQNMNEIRQFAQDDYIPTNGQQIVKYIKERENNVHIVEDYKGDEYLVSVPKSFHQAVWLRKGVCLVIDPTLEGNKIKWEIFCILSSASVIRLINNEKWPPKKSERNCPDGNDPEQTRNEYLTFFGKDVKPVSDSSVLPKSSSQSDSEKEYQHQGEVHIQVDRRNGSSIKSDSITLMSSGGVTVTTGEVPEQTQCESFEFGAECDSSEETNNTVDVNRLVNAIRIRVSYPNQKSTDQKNNNCAASVAQDIL